MITQIATSLLVWFMPFVVSAQPPRDRPFNMIVIGDAGEAGADLDGNARGMAQLARDADHRGEPVGLLLFLGDNFYPNGLNHESPAKRAGLIRAVLGPHAELMRRLGPTNVQAIPGNHDYYCRTLMKIPYGTCDAGNRYEQAIAEWQYHPHYPALVRYATYNGSPDSVDVLMFDSALLLTQERSRWRPVLDSLERMLRASAAAPGVRWRLLAAHHSPYSVGEHGGYRLWLRDEHRVGYIGNCYEEKQDPTKYVEELISDQDNCTRQYRAYADTLMRLVERSGAKVQAMLAGHDHSLQILNYPERNGANCPKVFLITGAGSKRARVKSPNPPREYTHPFNDDRRKGLSAAGFTHIAFRDGAMVIQYYDSGTGKALDMGGAQTFVVDVDGKMTAR